MVTTETVPAIWAKVPPLPTRLKMGMEGIAARCGWEVEPSAGGWNLRAPGGPGDRPGLVRPILACRAAIATDPAHYEVFRTLPPSLEVANAAWNDLAGRVNALFAGDSEPDVPEVLAAYNSVMTIAPTEVLPGQVQPMFELIAHNFPQASLWVVEADERIQARAAAVRAFFAINHAPELMARGDDDLSFGFEAGRGLISSDALSASNLITPALMVRAPWLLGVEGSRVGAAVVTLFGRLVPGRRDGGPAEAIQLFRPALLSRLNAAHQDRQLAPRLCEEFLLWWVARLDSLLATLLDPANFVDAAGRLDAADWFGALLTVDRLFAAVQGVLYGARRDEFTRRVLFFQVIDLLEGMGGPRRDSLLSHDFLRGEADRLSVTLSAEVREVVMSRCRIALEGLKELQQGFYLKERINSGAIRVRDKTKPGEQERWKDRSLDFASAKYLGVVRNAGHSFRQMVRDDVADLSLLAADDGDMAPEISDIALLHLLRVLENPKLLLRGSGRASQHTPTWDQI